MKPFQTLLFLAIIILIGGMAALYWGKTVQEVDVPVGSVEEPVAEPVEDELAAGSYLVFQSDEANFYRMAVADIGRREPFKFSVVKNPLTVSGGLTAYVYGQDLLLHRYLETEQDGIVGLDGELRATRPIQWGTIRSSNGRYEVQFETDYSASRAGATTMKVWDLQEDVLLQTVVMDTKEIGGWTPEPFSIDDRGEYFYAHEVCACEATLSGLWQIEIATGEVTRFDGTVGLRSWSLSSLNLDTRRVLAISTDFEPLSDGPGEELLPPTEIRILDLDSLEQRELLFDEKRVWSSPRLDPVGNDRYVVRSQNSVYLVNFDDTEITDENFLTDGWILDWVGDWIVVQNTQDSTLKLVNVESKEEVRLEIPGERVGYVGTIELEDVAVSVDLDVPVEEQPAISPIIFVDDLLPEHKDPFGFSVDEAGRSVWVEGNTLFVNVGYGGGCQEHEFTAYWNGLWAESAPPQTGVRLIHESNDDFCEAYIGPQTLQFDLSSITSVYSDFHFGVEGYTETIRLFVGSNYLAE